MNGLGIMHDSMLVGLDWSNARVSGRPVEEDLGPGLYWRWPWPVEAVTRVQPALVRTVEVGFRAAPGTEAAPGS